MTTIIITDREIAWDSQVTDETGEKLSYHRFDKVVVEGGRIFAFAGDTDLFEPVRKAIRRGLKPDKFPALPDHGEFTIIEISRAGMKEYTEAQKFGCAVIPPICIGTGARYARGAIEFATRRGVAFTASEIIEISKNCDSYTGGPVNTLNIEDALQKAESMKGRGRQAKDAGVLVPKPKRKKGTKRSSARRRRCKG